MSPMKYSHLILIISLLSVLSSCGQPSKSTGKKYTKITEGQIQDVMDHQIISCASLNNKPCPEGVSRLLILNKEAAEKSAVCTGFMVNKNTLVTNHHCVQNAADCQNTYIAVYNGHGYHQSKCKSIKKTLEDYNSASDPRRKIDFTVMEIEDDFFGNTFSLAAQSAVVDEDVTTWVVDHTGLDNSSNPNLFESRITEFKCKVKNQTTSASLVLENCPIIHGNSGSPVVNTAGDIVGIIWGATQADVSSQTPLIDRRAGSGFGIVTEMMYFSGYIQN